MTTKNELQSKINSLYSGMNKDSQNDYRGAYVAEITGNPGISRSFNRDATRQTILENYLNSITQQDLIEDFDFYLEQAERLDDRANLEMKILELQKSLGYQSNSESQAMVNAGGFNTDGKYQNAVFLNDSLVFSGEGNTDTHNQESNKPIDWRQEYINAIC
jgi:hypothetical protein